MTDYTVLLGTRVPPQCPRHPLVGGQYFFTLPKELLEDVVEAVGESEFNPALLSLERELSAECGDPSAIVGFRDGVPVRHTLLGQPLGLAAAVQHGVSN